MTPVERAGKDFIIESRLLAHAFGITEDEVRVEMRRGAITSRCEAGMDEDSGRWRLTFYHGNRVCRFVVGEVGNILKQVTFHGKARSRQSSSTGDNA